MWKTAAANAAKSARALGLTNEAMILAYARTPETARAFALNLNGKALAIDSAATRATIDGGDAAGSLYALKRSATAVIDATAATIDACDAAISTPPALATG